MQYYPEKDCIIWSIKQFVGQKEYFMRAHFGLPSVSSEESTITKAPISVRFEIPYFTVSGVQVRRVLSLGMCLHAHLQFV